MSQIRQVACRRCILFVFLFFNGICVRKQPSPGQRCKRFHFGASPDVGEEIRMTHNERQQRQFGPRGRKDNQRKWRLRRIASRARRLRIEPLEDRLLLAVDVQYEQLLPEYTVHQQDELLALLDESWSVDPVASRISPELRDIYQAVLANPDTPVSNDLIVFDEVGNVGVRITAEDVEALQTALGEVSFVTTGSYPQLHFVEGFLPANSLLELEQLSSQGLLGVLPMYRPATAVGKVDDQADYILESRRVRAAVPQGYDGTGITIGIISDSYDASQNARTRAAADIAQRRSAGRRRERGSRRAGRRDR